MKLIINIPDYNLNAVRNGSIACGQILKAVRNGKLYEEGQPGEWEDYSVDFYRCPECGYLLNKDCPHCQNKVILPKGGAE